MARRRAAGGNGERAFLFGRGDELGPFLLEIRRRLRGAEPLDAWGRRASEQATVILGTWSFVGRGYSDNDSADLAVTTAARTREYPDAA